MATEKATQARATALLRLLRNRMPARHRYHWVEDNAPDIFTQYRDLSKKLEEVKEVTDLEVELFRKGLEDRRGVAKMKKELEGIADQIEERLKSARTTLDEVSIKVTAGKDLDKQIDIMMKVAENLKLITVGV